MEKYRIPPKFEITDQTQLDDWKKWQKFYRSYALASNLVEKSHEHQLSSFKSLLGERALEVYRSFSIVDTTDVDTVFGKFDELFVPKVNRTRERYKLYRLSQKSGQCFDDFLADVTNQVDKCGFRSMRDDILLYKIVGGIVNDAVREALLEDEDLQFEKAVQICRASTDAHFMLRNKKCDDDQKEQINPEKMSKRNLKRSEKRIIRNKAKRNKKSDLESVEEVRKLKLAREKAAPQSLSGNVENPVDEQDGVEEMGESFSEKADPTKLAESEQVGLSSEKLSQDRSTEDIAEPADSVTHSIEVSFDLDSDRRPSDDDDDFVPETVVKTGEELDTTTEIDGKNRPYDEEPSCSEDPQKHSLIDLKADDISAVDPDVKSKKAKTKSPLGNFPCDVCGKIFPRKKSLKRHSLIHLRVKTKKAKTKSPLGNFPCDVCGKIFPRKKSLKRHSLIHLRARDISAADDPVVKSKKAKTKSPAKNFFCTVCGKSFPRKKSLTRHNWIHDRSKMCGKPKKRRVVASNDKPTNLFCNLCNKVFTRQNSLKRHQVLHSKAKVFMCYYCEMKFALKPYVLRHMVKKHPKEVGVEHKFYTCDECEYKTIEPKNMERHKFKHSAVKPLSCELCYYQCIVKSQMVSHMARHSGEKPFTCNRCDFKSTSESSLLVHRKLKHSERKPFPCKVCDQSFKLRSALRSHMYTHTGERPFACTVCDRKFRQAAHVLYHMRTHTGEKPYVCDVCGHPWATKGNLTSHMKIHDKESTQSSPARKRQRKPKPDQAVEAPPAAIPQWSEQIATINPVECFTGLEPYQAYPLGTRPPNPDCQYYQQRPSQWPNSQNVNVMPIITGDEFQ